MNTSNYLLLFFVLQLLGLILVQVHGNKPIRSISVTVRGKKFDVEDAVTVQDILGQVKEAAGVEGRLLFGGRQLAATDSLEDVGIKEGDSLQMVPSTGTSAGAASGAANKKKKVKPKTVHSTSVTVDSGGNSGNGGNGGGGGGGMPDLNALLKGATGEGMPDLSAMFQGGMPDMSESLDMMSNMMKSPIFQEYMSDPEKLEESRQMILQNPMMRQMMTQMPGMSEILENKDAWREAMTAAANIYKEMDPDQLKQAMMGNLPGPNDMDGLFGNNNNGENDALDELDEDD
jgi:hypothetical protein